MTNIILYPIIIILILVKIISIYLTSFDLFGDEAQYWLWSKNLDLGYYSKPPFIAWFINVYSKFFGDSFFSLKLIPSIVYLLTSLAVYDLCKGLGLKRDGAINCSLLFLIMPAVSFSSFIISTDIFLLFFWTISLSILLRLKKNPSLTNFISLGATLGLAFLSKYAAIYFLICLIFLLILDKEFRIIFFKNYIASILCFVCTTLILLPNIYWNLNNGWITLQHTSDNANLTNIKPSIYRGLEFLLVQLLMIGPFLFFIFCINFKNFKIDATQKFLLVFSVPIFIIVLLEAIIVRANANWAAPALISFFIFLYINSLSANINLRKLNIFFNTFLCLVLFVLIGISYPLKIFDRISGLKDFSYNLHNETSKNNILNYVISDRLIFASMSYELRNKNLFFYMPHDDGREITNHFKITAPLKKEMSDNFLLVGDPNDIKYLTNKYRIEKKSTIKKIFTNKHIDIYEVFFK